MVLHGLKLEIFLQQEQRADLQEQLIHQLSRFLENSVLVIQQQQKNDDGSNDELTGTVVSYPMSSFDDMTSSKEDIILEML